LNRLAGLRTISRAFATLAMRKRAGPAASVAPPHADTSAATHGQVASAPRKKRVVVLLLFPMSMVSTAHGLPMAQAERTALRWPKIPLVSASLRCEVRTVGASLRPKSFAAICPWFGLQCSDCYDSYLVGVLR
jgi:hypothetical protein